MTIVSATPAPPYYTNQPITITASGPNWTPASQDEYDANECVQYHTNQTPVGSSITNWWAFRYSNVPMSPISGSGLSATFSATDAYANAQLNFYSSNYTAAHGLQFSDTRSVSTYITVYKFVHETEELCPDDPATRRDIGAGEVVNLSIQPGPTSTTWKLSGDTNVGEIQDTSSSENQFSAFQTAGTAIITATTFRPRGIQCFP